MHKQVIILLIKLSFREHKLLFVSVVLIMSCSAMGQFMPLDYSEMKWRVSSFSKFERSVCVNDTLLGMGLDLSLVNLSPYTIFIAPYHSYQISPKASLKIKMIITNNPDYGPRIGSRYSRTGNYIGPEKPGDLAFTESYFSIHQERIQLLIGKIPTSYNSTSRFGILSNFELSPSYGFWYKINIAKLDYSQFHYWLGYSSDGDLSTGLSRYYAGQQVKIQGGKYLIIVGNRVIYSGADQSVNWRYLVPFDPYAISIFNRGSPRNDNNHIIEISMYGRLAKDFEIGSELVIDEFQVDKADRDINDDDWGINLSAVKFIQNSVISSLRLNYLYASDYLGIHYGGSTNYEILGIPILSRYGPQTIRIEFVTSFDFNHRAIGWFSLYRESKGDNTIINTRWQPMASDEDQISWTSATGVELEILVTAKEYGYVFGYLDTRDGKTTNVGVSFLVPIRI